ncbi:hypothetical protein CG736_16710 [Kitasatospora sp. CB02891]|nr:hypothetical protein CG736_16710 [Kitasatospora sp. CB02891]
MPVLRTPDLTAAHGAVRRLLGLVIPMDGFHVGASVQALTAAEAQRMVAAFPDGVVGSADPSGTVSNDEVRAMAVAGDPRVADLLPVELHLENRPVGSIEEAFFEVVGAGTGSIDWDWFHWPAVPELGLGARHKDAHLQVAVNSLDVCGDVQAAVHTVFIHFRSGDEDRAEWLAQQVGLRPVGPVELGW